MDKVNIIMNNRFFNVGVRASLLLGTVVLFGYVGLSDKVFNPYFENKVERVYFTRPDYANKSVIFYQRDQPHTIREV
ncbi:transmembrane protein, putative (macronuclear) [Tetrahymena thermophila SB210]|uniref:Transmembrane protein, putative n=1 Tax=Tetrahymena thermophila (strain SB210) TaxID=312017 RepID=Q22S01_TETTS|nr:transmembrane protein, putative [Tetrahymena thermophila SB210]EAR87971.2 transmembrane protein, putative [Tetrahymena thermophila SB210]|eukprot:XP_001008216.2 transmembrane protein, putative [Tetrahymena thermophila SB210]